MAKPTKALSIRAPWWWFILHGGKDIENRDWPTNFRGTVYVHASKWWRMDDVVNDSEDAAEIAHERGISGVEFKYRELKDLGGHIVGTVEIVDCIVAPQPLGHSPWFFGDYGFVLANPVALAKPVPCKGALGFFTVPDEVLAQIKAQ